MFVAVKPLGKPDAANTVLAVVSALETDCEFSSSDWQSKLVGMSADGAAVNFGSQSGVAKRICDSVPHLVSVHCCAHRVELAIKAVSKDVAFFRVLEDTLVELYKLYKWPLCWNGVQEVGRVLEIAVLKPTKLVGTRWVSHRERALDCLLSCWQVFVIHTSQVAQGSTQFRERAHHLHSNLTSLKFFLFSRACKDFLAAIQSLSKSMQYDNASVDSIVRKLSATKERLEYLLSEVPSSISADVEALGENLKHLRYQEDIMTRVQSLEL